MICCEGETVTKIGLCVPAGTMLKIGGVPERG
jgi:hypothetical protein